MDAFRAVVNEKVDALWAVVNEKVDAFRASRS